MSRTIRKRNPVYVGFFGKYDERIAQGCDGRATSMIICLDGDKDYYGPMHGRRYRKRWFRRKQRRMNNRWQDE